MLTPEMTEEMRCCVCGNADPAQFTERFARLNWIVVQCNKCSFDFLPPYFRKQITYTQYKDESVTQQVRQGNNELKIQRHLLRLKLIRKYISSGKLFDLGSGWGHFMMASKRVGFDVYGIEISEQPYLYSKNDLNLPVDHIDFFEMKEAVKFDVITMWDVLEHIDAADKVLEKCNRITNKGGYVVIQVPQIDSYIAKRQKSNWKMMGLDHVNYFSRKTITNLLEQKGYKVERIKSSIELKLFVMYTLLPMIRKKPKPTAEGAPAKHFSSAERQEFFNKVANRPKWVLKLMVFAHNILYNMLSFFRIGEEMIVIARKVKD